MGRVDRAVLRRVCNLSCRAGRRRGCSRLWGVHQHNRDAAKQPNPHISVTFRLIVSLFHCLQILLVCGIAWIVNSYLQCSPLSCYHAHVNHDAHVGDLRGRLQHVRSCRRRASACQFSNYTFPLIILQHPFQHAANNPTPPFQYPFQHAPPTPLQYW